MVSNGTVFSDGDVKADLDRMRVRIAELWPQFAAFRERQRRDLVDFVRARSTAATEMGRLLESYRDGLRRAWPKTVADKMYREMLADIGMHVRTAQRYIERARLIDGRLPTATLSRGRHRPVCQSDRGQAMACGPVSPLENGHEDLPEADLMATNMSHQVRDLEPSRTSADPRPPVVIGRQLEIDYGDVAETAMEYIAKGARAISGGSADGAELGQILMSMVEEFRRRGIK